MHKVPHSNVMQRDIPDENTTKKFETISITERKNRENYLIFGRETSVIGGIPHHAECLYVWRKEDGEWKLQKEYIELES